MTAVELINALRRHKISASELLEMTITYAEGVSKKNTCFTVKLYNSARCAAKNSDILLLINSLSKQELCGPLCGLPITISDSQWLSGIICTNGGKRQKKLRPNENYVTVRSLEEAGAIIFAKTKHTEFNLINAMTRPEFIRSLITFI